GRGPGDGQRGAGAAVRAAPPRPRDHGRDAAPGRLCARARVVSRAAIRRSAPAVRFVDQALRGGRPFGDDAGALRSPALRASGAGEFFGEMSILNHKPRSAGAVVAEDAKLLVIDPKKFEAMIRGNVEIAVRLI